MSDSQSSLFKNIYNASTIEELDAIQAKVPPDDEATLFMIRLKRENAKLEAVITKRTVISALAYGKELGKFAFGGKSGSSQHRSAASVVTQFSFTPVQEEMKILGEGNGSFRKQLREAELRGLFEGKNSLIAFNEAEVQGLVQAILQDAVTICNIMLGLQEEDSLFVRREANLFTNRPDHSAVYLSDRRVPVVTVEDKPGKAAVMDDRVHGQKFDQLLETVLLTWRASAIGAVTTIEETRIAWIGDDAQKLIEEGEFLSIEKLRECKKRLRDRKAVSEQFTPSPRKKEQYPHKRGNDLQTEKPTSHARKAKKLRVTPKRELNLSQGFKAEDIVHVFCNLIIAGILLHRPNAEVWTLPPSNEKKTIPACVVVQRGGETPVIDTLTTVICGSATKQSGAGISAFFRRILPSRKYYLVGLLGSGSSYKVFRALTHEGYQCVVKMYILEYDENGQKIADFDAKGKKAVSSEADMYQRVYPELADYVWTEKLCGRHCLILPFFEEVPKLERQNYVSCVGERYQECFISQDYGIKKERVLWRHIGIFGSSNAIFLYSLSQLEQGGGEVDRKKLEGILNDRMGGKSEEDGR